jgi:hypothetical protein
MSKFASFLSGVRTVDSYARSLGCDAFDNKLIMLDWFRRYIASQPNITLFEDETLPTAMYAVTLKRRAFVNERWRSLFIILVAPIRDPIRKQFVVAHELGHILLHGKLMRPGMLFRPIVHWNLERNPLEQSLEIEANVYALMSLIPTSVITALSRHAEPNAERLRELVAALYGHPVDLALVRERLLIHKILTRDPLDSSALLEAEFESFLLDKPCWTYGGPQGLEPDDVEHPPPRLSKAAIDTIRVELTTAGVIPSLDSFDWTGNGGMGIARDTMDARKA